VEDVPVILGVFAVVRLGVAEPGVVMATLDVVVVEADVVVVDVPDVGTGVVDGR
jgi:hypothetical protein